MKKGEGRVVKYPANGCQESCVPIPISPLNLSWAAVAAIHPQIATDRGPAAPAAPPPPSLADCHRPRPKGPSHALRWRCCCCDGHHGRPDADSAGEGGRTG